MDSCKNFCSVIQYYKKKDNDKIDSKLMNTLSDIESQSSVELDLKEILSKNSEDKLNKIDENHLIKEKTKGESSPDCDAVHVKLEDKEIKEEPIDLNELDSITIKEYDGFNEKSEKTSSAVDSKVKTEDCTDINNKTRNSTFIIEKGSKKIPEENLDQEPSEIQHNTRGRKRKLPSMTLDSESSVAGNTEDGERIDDSIDSDMEGIGEAEKPRRRGRKKGKKSIEVIPSHLSSDMVLGYKMLIKFLETPQFSNFHRPLKRSNGGEEHKITCLNQIKTKFEEKSYNNISEFVKDVREMLMNIYESRNSVAIKRALRLEQVLEQRIAQLPNYLRPQCALVLPPDETNNSHNKIRISKGGGFVSLLLEKTEKQRYEKNKEKRKILAEERKQLKEEQDKDVQEWEKNVLLKDFEEDIKSMWELPAIGHFIHLCADILNIGEVAQFEVERMLLMPQCSDTLDLIMTALLTNSLMRAKLDRTPSMPYSIWSPLVRTRIMSWYRMWYKEGRNEQKLFEEIGIEPEFWQILGPDVNPLEYCYFHEISFFQRVWVLKTLCDVDFIRKKTVHDNIRAQTLDELSPVYLGIDRHGNRYIQLKQFCASDVRIYRQTIKLEGDITMAEYVDSFEGFERREGPITADKIFRDIWEMNTKVEVKTRKRKIAKTKKQKSWTSKVVPDCSEKKNLRKSVRAKQKTYVDWSDSDQSDTDLHTLKKKLSHSDAESLYRPFSDKEFISLSVFRLPRDKITKPTPKKSGYIKKTEDSSRNDNTINDKNKLDKVELEENKEDAKSFRCDDEQSDSLDAKQMQDMQTDFEKTFHGDETNDDEFDLDDKLGNFKLEKESENIKFAVQNLENLKVVFKKGTKCEELEERDLSKDTNYNVDNNKKNEKPEAIESDSVHKYNVPDCFKPDSSKFYLVVDSVESLRQLISKFGSHENDLEIITRSTKAQKKKINQNQNNRSCEVELIERLQNLLLELEPWEIDFMKSQRSNKEKMYKEYMNFINRPPDFVHPNESYWMKTCEEPAASSTASTSTTVSSTTTTATFSAADKTTGNGEKGFSKDVANVSSDSVAVNQQDNLLDGFLPRRRTRVTRLQLQPEDNNDSDEDYNIADDYESNESDDNWVLPTSKKKAKKETTAKSLRFSRRSGGRKAKTSCSEKSDSGSNANEKPQSSSPEKNKKALFWGPRSSNPSEDLNWEKNRQKILEQHNSPVKKNLYAAGETTSDMMDVENTLQLTEKLTASVITASPKRIPAPIPGNKKPYFSSAQLKAMDNQAKHKKSEESEVLQQKSVIGKGSSLLTNAQSTIFESSSNASNKEQEFVVKDSKSKAPVKIQTYSRSKGSALKQSPQYVASLRQPSLKQVAVPVVTKLDAVDIQDNIKLTTQIRGQIHSTANLGNSAQIQNAETLKISTPSNVIQQKGGGQLHIQIQQPGGQVLQSKAIATAGPNVRLQQPIQWQPKVVTFQSVGQQGKVIQQQIQSTTQVPLQSQGQSQIQDQQMQQLVSTVQVQPEKAGSIQSIVISQPETLKPDSDLYVTDGKLLMKFDDSFVQQYLSKNKAVAVNVNDKLDLKKPLLIVKPKLDTNSGAGQIQIQGQQSANQSNVVVVNKPVAGTVPQNITPSSVQNIVIPANYIIKENINATSTGQQSVKIVQQAPTYIIQQKAVAGKSPQSQIIKIVTSQPMAGNPGLIINPASLGSGNQILRPVPQAVVETDQQTKSPTTVRFLRPQIATSMSQNKMGVRQNSIIMNNIVHIQGQDVDASKSPVVASKIIGSASPTVRLATPIQTHQVVSSGNATQSVRLSAQPLKVVVNSSTSQVQTPSTVTLNPQAVRPMSVNAVRLPLGTQHPGVLTSTSSGLHTVTPATAVRVVASGQEPTIIATMNPQRVIAGETATQTLRVVTSAQPLQMQPQTVETPTNLNQIKMGTVAGQSVRLAAVGQPQTVKLVTGSSLGPRLIRQGSPGKVTVITAAPQSSPGLGTSTVRPVGIVGQPTRLQSVVQSTGSSNQSQTQTQ